ncbi:putative sugar transporter, high affinity [Spathaspora passalidarum NRRL Y-27907]|uniref:Putative sugar transporter, high affinity n=1 Tax=Spathaspora passalidarum (strain NRRL Y-27907 / 11-Y1) TaxID=619300 RepID=G3AHK8_SPAPN|nr:putative sugar transporter, high affinity [Spathaspora passalidarum NRRL Y-27907]EGW34172.1 putative sugar transporter, high affinity [Spathaspora passalidarum NRRL Y-27907]
MHGGSDGNDVQAIIAQKRLEIAGKPGIAGLIANRKSFLIAVFASLGGLVYGYNQGMFGQISGMTSFSAAAGVGKIQDNPTLQGLLTSILELGAWVGVLMNGYVADRVGRRWSVMFGVAWFILGVIIQACTHGANYSFILGGRFIVGVGVGILSMIVPLYNAEVAPPEIRGSLVALQQLAITFGIMISYWITYGTNFIGGTGEGQSKAAWLVPICIQMVPALILGSCIFLMPESPRWLMNEGNEEKCLDVLSRLRGLDRNNELIQMEFLEMKAQKIFEHELEATAYPDLQDGSASSRFKIGFLQYKSMLTHYPTFKRVAVACLIMTFQQWTGVNFILYYAPFIFASLGLSGKTTSLLASGVVGIVMFLATIPAVLWVDQLGRKPVLISGALLMGMCHFVVAGILGGLHGDFTNNMGAGWAAVVFIWLFAIFFGYSWGPCAWVIVAEVFPLGLRAKGVSIGASSNWLNNFAVAMSTPDFVAKATYGAYIFLGLMCVFGAAYVFFFCPETKGRTLDEIDELFGDTSGVSKREGEIRNRILKEVGLLELIGLEELDSDKSKGGDVHYQEEKAADADADSA